MMTVFRYQVERPKRIEPCSIDSALHVHLLVFSDLVIFSPLHL